MGGQGGLTLHMKGSWGEVAERQMSERRRTARPEDLRIGSVEEDQG